MPRRRADQPPRQQLPARGAQVLHRPRRQGQLRGVRPLATGRVCGSEAAELRTSGLVVTSHHWSHRPGTMPGTAGRRGRPAPTACYWNYPPYCSPPRRVDSSVHGSVREDPKPAFAVRMLRAHAPRTAAAAARTRTTPTNKGRKGASTSTKFPATHIPGGLGHFTLCNGPSGRGLMVAGPAA